MREDITKCEMSVAAEAEQERRLGMQVTAIEKQAGALVVADDDGFAAAGAIARDVKATQKKVEEYWEPMRSSTYAAYKAVTDHKNEMIKPLKNAEKIIKQKMSDYQTTQKKKQAEAEARLREMARQEMERKLREAAEAESNGDLFGAEYAKTEAKVMEAVASTAATARQQIKVDGIAQSVGWRIRSIDLSKLPCEFMGTVIRPADEKAIMRLIKASGGSIEIPGVKYEETVNLSVRAS